MIAQESQKGRKKANANVTDFKLDKIIGIGSFGVVYYGFDMNNGKPIAVKQVPISAFGMNSET